MADAAIWRAAAAALHLHRQNVPSHLFAEEIKVLNMRWPRQASAHFQLCDITFGLRMFRLRDESSSGGWGAYARDKNTSARLCGKNAGGRICVWCTDVSVCDTPVML